MKSLTKTLDGKTLKLITKKFSKEWKRKIRIQCDIPTAHDHVIKEGLTLINENMEYIPWNETLDKILLKMEDFAPREIVESFISHMVNWHYGRFVEYDNRKTSTVKNQGDINLEFLNRSDKERNFSMSQGRFSCLKWKNTIVFKTVYDFAIYQMLLWEIKPKTILEIGSGNGGSAIWMSDLITIYKIDCKILSIDIHPPNIVYENITFLKGDCNLIESVLSDEVLKEMKHPILIIEDAHVNVEGVLNYFHRFLKKGDYLIIEDSLEKQHIIARFLSNNSGEYKVDTHYCDFFGHNLTCSYNSIFRKS